MARNLSPAELRAFASSQPAIMRRMSKRVGRMPIDAYSDDQVASAVREICGAYPAVRRALAQATSPIAPNASAEPNALPDATSAKSGELPESETVIALSGHARIDRAFSALGRTRQGRHEEPAGRSDRAFLAAGQPREASAVPASNDSTNTTGSSGRQRIEWAFRNAVLGRSRRQGDA